MTAAVAVEQIAFSPVRRANLDKSSLSSLSLGTANCTQQHRRNVVLDTERERAFPLETLIARFANKSKREEEEKKKLVHCGGVRRISIIALSTRADMMYR